MSSTPSLRLPHNQVPPRALVAWIGSAALSTIILLGITFTIVSLANLDLSKPAVAIPVTLIVLWRIFATTAAPILRRNRHRWEVSDQAVYTRVGVLSTHTTIVPINRLQSVNVKQGVIARLLGLADVSYTTAGSSNIIGMLDKEDAQHIADKLTHIISLDKSDAT